MSKDALHCSGSVEIRDFEESVPKYDYAVDQKHVSCLYQKKQQALTCVKKSKPKLPIVNLPLNCQIG